MYHSTAVDERLRLVAVVDVDERHFLADALLLEHAARAQRAGLDARRQKGAQFVVARRWVHVAHDQRNAAASTTRAEKEGDSAAAKRQ